MTVCTGVQQHLRLAVNSSKMGPAAVLTVLLPGKAAQTATGGSQQQQQQQQGSLTSRQQPFSCLVLTC
jgi:hypothetical protein